jgi:dihydroflavonol-4-reductase
LSFAGALLLTLKPRFYNLFLMKNFVTGGTGFLGAALVRKLIERGEEVVCLARRGCDGRNLEGLPVRVAYGDLLDAESLTRGMEGCRRVYHAAAEYSLWVPDSSRIYEVNVQGTKNVFEAASMAGVERVVYTSTVGALGNPGDGTPGTEDTPVTLADMAGDYKRSKFMAERLAEKYGANGPPVVIVNPSTQDVRLRGHRA